MPQPRLKMKNTIQILRHHFDLKLSNQNIASVLKVGKTTVFNTLQRFKESNLNWIDVKGFSEDQLEEKLYACTNSEPHNKKNFRPDYEQVHTEMQRPHVTLALLYDEFKVDHPDGIGRSQYYDGYKVFRKNSKIEMKMIHKAGDKFFVDYSGDSIKYFDKDQNEFIKTQMFVGTWGASNYCYCEVTATQNQEDWVYSHVRAFKYSGCVPAAIVPDNLKSGVLKPDLYDPTINPLYAKFAEHYECAVLPARVRKPKDKGIVESHVLHLQRHILGRLRNRDFYSLAQINDAILEELELFNNRPMKGYGEQTRVERFNELDKKHSQALPLEPFEISAVKQEVRVAPNYHIQYSKHHYSVPHILIGEKVDIHQKGNILEIYHKGIHVCRHKKEPGNYGYSTKVEHMPKSHEYVKGWSIPWFMSQAEEIGVQTSSVIKKLFETKIHPEQGFKSARGIITLSREYGNDRMENASRRALKYGHATYKTLKDILAKELDKQLDNDEHMEELNVEHENIRGEAYYAEIEGSE